MKITEVHRGTESQIKIQRMNRKYLGRLVQDYVQYNNDPIVFFIVYRNTKLPPSF